MKNKKIYLISFVLLVVYLILFYHEVNGYNTDDIDLMNIAKLMENDWDIKGDIQMNKNYSINIEGKLVKKGVDSYFDLYISPSIRSKTKKEMGFELNGIINNDSIILNQSLFNEEKIVITIEDLLSIIADNKTYKVEDNKFLHTFFTTELEEKKNLDFKWYTFVDVQNSQLSKEVASKYRSVTKNLGGKLEIVLIIVNKELRQMDLRFNSNESLSFNIRLHQSHF